MSLKNLNVKTKIPKFFQNKLKNKRINEIYKKFEQSFKLNNNFIVAVSGGPDSLALAFLTKIYSIKYSLKSYYIIIDHKLRFDSSEEAKSVKKILHKKSINSEIIVWKGKKPKKNIQSLAREKRYELLINKCKNLKINNIVLGHHKDDLVENFFIRLMRGSGLKGLISLDSKAKFKHINLYRPLLNFKKKDLIYVSKNVFNFFVIDPSNNDEKYRRVKIRGLLENLKNEGLDSNKISLTLKNLKYASNSIDFYVKKNLEKNIFFFEKKAHVILSKEFFEQSFEVNFRSFSAILNKIGNRYYNVRGKKIERLIRKIKYGSFSKETLGGCLIEKINQSIILSPEKK